MPPSRFTLKYEKPKQSEIECSEIRTFNPIKWFKKIREEHKKQREKYFREQKKREDELTIEQIRLESIAQAIDNMDKFPGNLEEYNKFKGIEHSIIDTGLPDKLVHISSNLLRGSNLDYCWLEKLISSGCKGFIYYKELPKFEHIVWIGRLRSGSYDRPYIQKCGVPVRETEKRNKT